MKRLLVAVLALSLSCGGGEKAAGSKNEQAALGGDVAARIDGVVPIPVSLVSRVAAEQHVAPNEALRRLVDDAVSAQGAQKRGLDHAEPAQWLLTAGRARWLADRFMADARASGPPTKEEVDELTKVHWVEVDRPPGWRVVHALAMRPKNPADYGRAKEIAEQLRQAVLPAKDEADFIARAKAVPHPAEIETRAESLPPFTAEGKLFDGSGGGMALPFAQGASTLTKPGETSGIVESSFGWHVIRLLELTPEQRMPYEARAVAFAEEAYTMRAHEVTNARLTADASGMRIEVSPSAESLMESLVGGRANP